jgi:hypothetical protein
MSGPAHVEQRAEVRVDDGRPLFRLHAMKHGVAGNARVVDEYFDGSDFTFHFLDAFGAGVIRGHIPFEDGNTGLGLEFLRSLVIAAVIGGDLVTCRLQRLGDRSSNSTGSPRYQCNARHGFAPSNSFLEIHVLKTSWPGQARP